MANILIQLNSGPEDPTKVALAFVVAKTAQEEGNETSLFLTGDAVQVLRDAVIDNLVGVGIGALRDHYDAFVKAGGQIYASALSSKGRGLEESDIAGKPVEWATPSMLVGLTLKADRSITF